MYENQKDDIPNKLVRMMEEHIELGVSLFSFLDEAAYNSQWALSPRNQNLLAKKWLQSVNDYDECNELNMFNDLVNFSFDLYDMDSNITLEVSTDNITIKFNDSEKREMVLWIEGGEIYPQLVHDFHSSHAIPIDMVIKILEITREYMN